MPVSPAQVGRTVLAVSIESDGAPIDQATQLLSVTVHKGVGRIPKALLVLADGDMPSNDFPLSGSATFRPGAVIRISVGYDGSESPIFEGIVVRQGISVARNNLSTLVVECRDRAVAMTLVRKSACFTEMKDSDVFTTLIADHGGLRADVEDTSYVHPRLVQYYCTDWDFLVSRAEVNGQLVIVEAGLVSVKAPDTSAAPELRVTWGQDLLEFEAEMDARWQRSSMRGVGWNPAEQDAVEGDAPTVDLGLQGDLDSSTLAGVLQATDPQEALQSPIPLDGGALSTWARARQLRAELARVRGRMTFEGSALVNPGGLIELSGVGSRFEGNVFVGSVLHEISSGSWTTEVDFGVDPYPFLERKDVMAPPASGMTPGIHGLHVGVVRKLDEHPSGEPMVLVTIMSPGLSEGEAEAVWARITTLHASDGFGSFFIPEIGDEVILGFLNDDPSHPVIVGSVYSSMRKPPYDLTADNHFKALVTRSKLKLEFDDDQKVVTVVTPAGNTLVLSDQEQSIRMEDQNGNTVELNSEGIFLASPGDVRIDAKGTITISAVGDVDVSSDADVKAAGLNVSCEAQVGFTGKGSATAELSASGQTTVKGAMVMIN